MDDAVVPPPMPQSAAPPDLRAVMERGYPPSGVVDAAGVVAEDAPCRKCSYNLKGLAVAGRCPECGTPVGVSVHGDLLRYSEPQWLMKLSNGAAFIFWGILFGVGLGIVAGVFIVAIGPWVGIIVNMLAGLASLYGAWLLTEPDPSGIGEDRYGTSRRIIRVGVAANLVGYAVNMINLTAVPPPELRTAITIVGVMISLIHVVGQFAMLRYLEKLSLRIPDERLSRTARTLFWGYGCALAGTILVGGLMAVVTATSGGRPDTTILGLLTMFGCGAVIALIGFGIWFLVFLRQLQSAFSQQAHYSRQIWNSSSSA